MLENQVMERKKQIFQLDARLKEQFNAYCTQRGLVQEQVLEALVFFLVKRDLLAPDERDNLLSEVATWKTTGEDQSGEAGKKADAALRRGAASRQQSRSAAG